MDFDSQGRLVSLAYSHQTISAGAGYGYYDQWRNHHDTMTVKVTNYSKKLVGVTIDYIWDGPDNSNIVVRSSNGTGAPNYEKQDYYGDGTLVVVPESSIGGALLMNGQHSINFNSDSFTDAFNTWFCFHRGDGLYNDKILTILNYTVRLGPR